MTSEQSNAAIRLMSENYMGPTDAELLGMLIVVVAIPTILFILLFLSRFTYRFSMELRYLNMEIGRTEGEECRYYMRRRRRLWLSLLPFVRY